MMSDTESLYSLCHSRPATERQLPDANVSAASHMALKRIRDEFIRRGYLTTPAQAWHCKRQILFTRLKETMNRLRHKELEKQMASKHKNEMSRVLQF